MCCALFCSCVAAAISLFSYSWLLVLPVFGIVFGLSAFSKLSLLVTSALPVSQLVPDIARWIFPFVDIAVVAAAVVVPLPFIPEWTADLWLLLFSFLEPVFLVVEVLQVVKFIGGSGQRAQEGIMEQPAAWKALVLSVTLLCWVLSISVFMQLSSVDFGGTLLILVLLNVFAHAFTIWVDEGIISDAAFVLLASAYALWLGSAEEEISAVICSSIEQRQQDLEESATVLGGLVRLPYISSVAPLVTVRGIRQVARSSFWFGIVIRTVSVLFAIKGLLVRPKSKWEDDDVSVSSSVTDLGGHFVARLAALVAYSQAVWRLLDGCQNTLFRLGRPSQAFLAVLVYVFQLQLSRESDWVDY